VHVVIRRLGYTWICGTATALFLLPVLLIHAQNPAQEQEPQGSYRAAARRFDEATKWNPDFAEAWHRLGEAYVKLGDTRQAREAWGKFLELQPDGKTANDVRKRMNRSK
jgi:tetratricopeptide (TPR) repeat protein